MRLRRAAGEALAQGSLASIASTLTLGWLVRRRGHRAAGGTNATSHWLWGRRAWRVQRVDARHTLAGYAIHHVCSVFWAVAFALWNRQRPAAPRRVAVRAGTIAAVAAAVDYGVVPRRLTPGFEAHLRPAPIALVYVAFAAGLFGAYLLRGASAGRRWRPR